MSASPYVPFYTSDFLGGTSGMTAASKGVYITLLCLIYEAEEPLPQSWETIARRCGCTLPAFKRAVEALQDDGKIEVTGAGIWSDKCAKHIAQRRERQSSAKAAAKTRWEKIQENQRPSDKTASKSQCQPEPEPEPEVKRDTNVSLDLSPPEPANPISEAVSIYNDAAEQVGWPKVQKLTPARSKTIKARLAECGGVEGWRMAMDKGKKSDFLTGKATGTTPASFDWLSKQSNFAKLMEGNYDNRTDNSRNSNTNTPDRGIAIAAGFARTPSRDSF